MKTFVGCASFLVFALSVASAPAAIDTSGTLFYTTFSGGMNLHKAEYSWVGGVLSFPTNTTLGPGVFGADGILFLPNGNLAVGGQGPRVHEVTPLGVLVTTLAVPTDSYHLSLSPEGKVLYSASIPGALTAITLNGSGGLAGAAALAVATTGTHTVLDTIAWNTKPTSPDLGKSLYTSSGAGGFGVVGTIGFTGGPEAPTAAMTSAPVSVTASHGMAYDPFSDSFITMGDNEISRFSSAGVLLETLSIPGLLGADFDQGTVDGLGHIFAANNGGHLYLIDYSASGTLLAASTVYDDLFLAADLDDLAPKVGPGSSNGAVPEPSALVVWSLLACIGGSLGYRRCRR